MSQDSMLDVSLDGSAILRFGSRDRSDEPFDLWVDGKFWQRLDCVQSDPEPRTTANRLTCDHLDSPLEYWRQGTEEEREQCVTNFSDLWKITDLDTAYLSSTLPGHANAFYSCPIEGQYLTAIPEKNYRFSGLFALHRCAGRIQLTFYDSKKILLDTFESIIPPGAFGGKHPNDYFEVAVNGLAPPQASHLSVSVLKGETDVGDDSFLFFASPMLTMQSALSCRDGRFFKPQTTVKLFSGMEEAVLLLPQWPTFLSERGIHDVGLVACKSGERFDFPMFSLLDNGALKLDIFGLEGSTIVGRVLGNPKGDAATTLSLWVDGALVTLNIASVTAAGDEVRIPLPLSVCDGRPHLFQLRALNDGQIVGQFADIGPDSLTPWDALQRYSGSPLPLGRAPAMEYRYRALAEGLRAGSKVGGRGENLAVCDWANLMTAHDLVVEGFERVRTRFSKLCLPTTDTPRVSVVIPVHNKMDVTYNCLAALILAHNKTTFEVIIVDDGSSDGTDDLPLLVDNLIYVKNEHALGFVGACNVGANLGRGEFITFLNNDTEPTVGWLDELLFAFDSFDDVGLVGSKLLFGDGRLQEAGGIVWETGDPWNYGRGSNARAPQFCYTREVDYLSGASVMISRKLWQEVGGFSQEFMPAYFEDTDLAFKVKASGKRVVFTPFSVVYHFEGLSNGTDTSSTSGLKRYQEINRPKFKRKWRANFKNNGKLGIDVDLAKDRGITFRAVFFDADTPRLDNDAGSYAALQEIRLLQSLGFKVTFVPSNLAFLGRHTELLQRLGVEMIYSPFYKSVEDFITKRATEFDLAFITRYQVAERVTELLRREVPDLAIVCNVADLHFLRAIREAALGPPDEQKFKEIEQQRADELEALGKVDLTLTYSTIEQAVLASHSMERTKSALLPWVVDVTSAPRGFAERNGLAYLGGFGHRPNVLAVEFFVAEVMPLLRERLPGVPLRIYGSGIPESLRKLAAVDIIFCGYVADVQDVFDKCRVFVAPLLYGAGVKGKVLDCLAAGVPAVLSPAAAESLPLTSGVEAFIADHPAEWVDAIAAIYEDERRWTRMSEAMRVLAEQSFSFARARQTMQKALELVDLHPSLYQSALCAGTARPQPPG